MQAVRRGSEARRRGRELEELNTLGDAVALARLMMMATIIIMMSITIRECQQKAADHSVLLHICSSGRFFYFRVLLAKETTTARNPSNCLMVKSTKTSFCQGDK